MDLNTIRTYSSSGAMWSSLSPASTVRKFSVPSPSSCITFAAFPTSEVTSAEIVSVFSVESVELMGNPSLDVTITPFTPGCFCNCCSVFWKYFEVIIVLYTSSDNMMRICLLKTFQ